RRHYCVRLYNCFPLIRIMRTVIGLVALALTAHGQDVISVGDRMKWVAASTVGPATLAGGAVSAGWGTLLNSPSEYGTHWGGFGKRYGMRLTGVASSNLMEAGLGAAWNEDPRY